MNLEQAFQKGAFRSVIRMGLTSAPTRRVALPFVEKKIWRALIEDDPCDRPWQVQKDKFDIVAALLHSVDRALKDGRISKHVLHRLLGTLLDNVWFNQRRQQAEERLGFEPPLFLTISPGKRCNLHCTGCYAYSDARSAARLDWDTFDRILAEKERLWGSYFTVISGGEPFLWEDRGRNLLDMIAAHPSHFFLVYTNGTLITEPVAGELARLGNATPAISVEGFETETDGRRGQGVHRRILGAMARLREVGVPFGISVTATRENADLVTSDGFADYYFDEQGATYAWLFQYMPIGRGHTLDLMVTPAQRLRMYERTWRMVRERRRFVADLWNSGTATNGCIAAGRTGGYLYIDWNGDVTPCVFVPYAAANIKEIFRNGGNLDTLLGAPFLKRIRRWQGEYGYARSSQETGNWLCPCSMRDHFQDFLHAVRECEARPTDEAASAALTDRDYQAGMIAYGKEYGRLSSPCWRQQYLAEAAAPQAAGAALG